MASWTTDQDAFLRELKGLGNSFAQCIPLINARFGTDYSRSALVGRATRIGMSVPFKPRSLDDTPKPKRARGEKRTGRPSKAPSLVPSSQMRRLDTNDLIKLRCVSVEPKNIGLMDLNGRTCRYPFGDKNFTYCGHPTIIGRPYCGPHTGLTTGYG